MRNEKFTSGKWEAVIYSGNHRLDVWSGDDRIYQNTSITDLEEEVANAHLIAAAPDMYREIESEIQELKDAMKHYPVDSNDYEHANDLIDHKEKLLAKARGES